MKKTRGLPEYYTRWRKCIHCRQDYREFEQLGKLECRRHSRGTVYDPKIRAHRYACCGMSIDGFVTIFNRTGPGCDRHDHEDETQRKENIQHVRDTGMCARAIPLFLFTEMGLPMPSDNSILKVVSNSNAAAMHSMRDSKSSTLKVQHLLGESEFNLTQIAIDLAKQVMKGPFSNYILKKRGDDSASDNDRISYLRTQSFVVSDPRLKTSSSATERDFVTWKEGALADRYLEAIGFVLYMREDTSRDNEIVHLVDLKMKELGHASLQDWWKTLDPEVTERMLLKV